MNREQLITWVKSVIYPNGNNEIDAQKHQDLEIGVINTLMDSVASMANGYLGTIQANAPAPTPQKNGYYIFSTGGAIPYISGTPIVKVGDWLSVTYVGLNHTYTNVDKLLNLSDDYTVSNSNVGASLKAIYDGLAKLRTDLRGDSLLTIEQLEERNINTNERIDNVSKNIFDIGRGRLSGGTYAKADARLLVLQSGRSRNYQLAYTLLDGTSITENYKGAAFNDGQWTDDSNWQTLATKDYVDGQLVGVYDDVADFNASLGTFPTTGSGSTGYIMRADCYPVTVAGTVAGVSMKIGDILKAKIDNPAQVASNWIVMRNGVAYTPEDLANKNVANGYAGLDAAKKLANDIIRTDFRMSQGYIFDGVDDYLSIAHNDKLNFGTDDFSIQAFFEVAPSGHSERILYKKSDTGFGLDIYKTVANTLDISLYLDNGARYDFITNKVIYKKELISLFFVASGKAYIYINGVLDTSPNFAMSSAMDNTSNLYIGATKIANEGLLSGNTKLVRLFNRALSQSDVTYYENGGRPDLCRLMYADVINTYGELLPEGNFEDGLIGDTYVGGSGTVISYTINSMNPISGTKDARLIVSTVGNDVDRPIITFGSGIIKSNKIYKVSLDNKVNSGVSILSYYGFGLITRPLMKTLDGNKYIFYTDRNTPNDNLDRLSIYFDGRKLFNIQIDNLSIQQVGCVLELLPQNALPDRWLESANGLDAITFGSPAINTETPITDMQIVDNITNDIAIGVTNRDYTLPAGYLVDSVCVKSTVSLTALQLVNVSTSETLLTGKTVSSTAGKHLPITADQSSPTTDTTIRLNATGNTGLGFNIVINIKKCL